MILHAKQRLGLVSHSLDGLIVEVEPVHQHVVWQRFRVHRKSVVLRGDFNFARAQILDGLIGAAMAKFQFERRAAQGLAENLMAETDPKDRQPGPD